jgi:voltage-gated potassium channel
MGRPAPRRAVGGSPVERRPGNVHELYLFPAVVLFFVVQPVLAALSETASSLLVVPLALTLCVAIWSLDGGRVWTRVGLAILVATLLIVAAHELAPSRALFVTGTLCLDGLSLLCVALGIRWLFGERQITVASLLTAMSLYLLLGILFAMLHLGVYALDPGAYSGVSPGGNSKETAELVYFSIGTLTGTAFGDILPVHPIPRLLANAEAVVGQMYMAVLVATLVSNYVAGRASAGSRKPPAS